MVNVAVRKNQRRHGLVTQMLAREGHGRCGAFPAGERVHHNPSGLAFDEGDVGQIKATQLVNAIGDFE